MDVTQVLLWILAAVGFAWLTVNVHEYGHLAVGRAVGVPADSIRVRFTPLPPHVALRDGERWLAPDDTGYVPAFARFNPGAAAAWWYVAGGFVIESVVVIGAVAALAPVAPVVAALWLETSTAIFLVYVLLDVAGTWRRGTPTGDTSALWRIHAGATVALLLSVAVGRGLLLWWVVPGVW